MLEREFEKKCIADVEVRGGLMWKWVSPGQNGVPDRIIFWPGGVVHFVELKKPGKRAEPYQAIVHGWLRDRGTKVWVVNTPELWNAYLREVGRE